MKRIWKYPVEIIHRQIITMPKGAEILTVQMQHNAETDATTPFIWAIVDPTAPKEERLIIIEGTGNAMEISEKEKYIGTFQVLSGAYVWHVFEEMD